SRKLAQQKHFPAVDVLDSVSRVRDQVITAADREAANGLLKLEATYRGQEDLITVGAYKSGTDKALDRAIAFRPELLDLLRQQPDEGTAIDETGARVRDLAARYEKGTP
ncbi:MAG: EscN/YscN/HrcN family type III secretion system ATPase, partial [Gemmatimonadales bacterium]